MPYTPTYTNHAALPGIETAGSNQHFMVLFEEIKANDWDMSVNRYKEVEYEEVEYEAPANIINSIKQIDQNRNALLQKLEELL